ncbi:hypothetical protein AVEN_161774-1 [Araneus ventricosus]|uniref:Tc1-like transposase DDE domain-containing protein n=1 Tax=Araneus ventricosus TaxID=182803 RepID=A0A4Y2X5G7_ARAVE|nr:hypothetical protein AVEN_161774-1 [Araneus ventricosus]
MVWGAISYDSRITLMVIPRTLNANLHVSLLIQPVVLPFINSIQGGVFQQDNARPHTADVTQHALQSVDMLPWPARSPDLSPIEHVWDIIGRQLQRHPQPALTDQVQQAWNSRWNRAIGLVGLSWVKAQASIPGNELADQLAKEATMDGVLISLPAPYSYRKKFINSYIFDIGSDIGGNLKWS